MLTPEEQMQILKDAITQGSNVPVFKLIDQANVQKGQSAQTEAQQSQGLRGSDGNTAMSFPESKGDFNTKGMDFSIDVRKYDREGNLVRSYDKVPPGVKSLNMGEDEGTVVETPSQYQEGGFNTGDDTIIYPPGDSEHEYTPYNKEILDIRPKLQKKGLYNVENEDLQKAWEWEKNEKQIQKYRHTNRDQVARSGGVKQYQNAGVKNTDNISAVPKDPNNYILNKTLPEINIEEKDPRSWAKKTYQNYISPIGHTVLDVAGMVPGFGEPIDLVNAAWYGAEGNKVDAALTAASAIPFVGWGATTAKWGKNTIKAMDKLAPGGGDMYKQLKHLNDVNPKKYKSTIGNNKKIKKLLKEDPDAAKKMIEDGGLKLNIDSDQFVRQVNRAGVDDAISTGTIRQKDEIIDPTSFETKMKVFDDLNVNSIGNRYQGPFFNRGKTFWKSGDPGFKSNAEYLMTPKNSLLSDFQPSLGNAHLRGFNTKGGGAGVLKPYNRGLDNFRLYKYSDDLNDYTRVPWKKAGGVRQYQNGGFNIKDFMSQFDATQFLPKKEMSRSEMLRRQRFQESSFNSNAKNKYSGAMGIAQFMPNTITEMKNKGFVESDFNPYNASQSVDAQDKYMKWMSERPYIKGDKKTKQAKTLAGYNMGGNRLRVILNKMKADGIDINNNEEWLKELPNYHRHKKTNKPIYESSEYVNRILYGEGDFEKEYSKGLNKPGTSPLIKKRGGYKSNSY